MSSLLNQLEVQQLWGSLARVLNECPATQMRIIAGDAGWDRTQIPDGLDECGQFVSKGPIINAIDGQGAQWGYSIKAARVRRLAQSLGTFLEPKGMSETVNNAIRHCGFHFVNGEFVPVDAAGQIPV